MGLQGVFGASVVAGLLVGEPQVTITVPPPLVPGQTTPQGDRNYGPAHPVELQSIAFNYETYQRAHVITVGEIDALVPGQYWTLRDGSATVLLIPGYAVTASDLSPATGMRVEIRGIVRFIRKKEYVTVKHIDADLIEDPSLPVLPEPNVDHGWPRVSITVLAMADRGYRGTSKAAPAGALTREIIANPTGYLGKTVRILGQFRGNNLFGDLPAGSRRENGDWVLKDGDLALWVTGKAPRGKGWALDPGYKGDTVRWLEVAGKAEVNGGGSCTCGRRRSYWPRSPPKPK